MSIVETQACLARLYLSDAYRQWFYADAPAALASYRLEPEEREALTALPRNQLEMFAASLVAKRSKGAEAAYPASYLLDEQVLRRLYGRYHQLFPPRSNQSRADDAIAFGIFAETSLRDDEQVMPYASDLMRYERLFYAACMASTTQSEGRLPAPPDGPPLDAHPARRRHVALARFDYDVGVIEDQVRQGQLPDPDEVRVACTVLFIPNRQGREGHMLRINAATAAIVEQCNGQVSVPEVIAGTEAALGAQGLREAITTAILQLVAAGALAIDGYDADDRAETPYPVASESEGM